MTIGANLNGGSLTIGGAGATTSINSNITNVGSYGLPAAGRINIGSGTNAANTEMFLGSTTLSYNNIRGNIIHIADTGLSATGKVHIASGVNGGNATGSEIKIGDGASSTNLKGNSVVINSDTNGNTIIGNTTGGYTYIKGSNVGLGDDGGTIALGSTTPLSGTTSILNIRTPLTVGYAPSAITSINHIGGGMGSVFNFGTGNTTTVFTAYPCINNVPQGIYIIQALLYFYAVSPPKNIFTCLCRSSSPISSGQTSNFYVIGDSQLESFSQKPNTSYPYSISLVTIYKVSNPDNNIAFGVLTSVPSADTIYSKMTIMRIA
jgi:hypothetical protein